MSSQEEDIQLLKDEAELSAVSKRYETLLQELNKLYRQELRKLGTKKRVVPTKYILTREWIDRLLQDRTFRICWERKNICYFQEQPPNYVHKFQSMVGFREREAPSEHRWICAFAFPNIGGIPVEEGPELQVIVERVSKRKRLLGKKLKPGNPTPNHNVKVPYIENVVVVEESRQ